MIFTKKKKEQPLILYEKYKHDHHLNQSEEAVSKGKAKVPLTKHVCNLLITCILIEMIFLSAIGLITLINPQLRTMLELLIGL